MVDAIPPTTPTLRPYLPGLAEDRRPWPVWSYVAPALKSRPVALRELQQIQINLVTLSGHVDEGTTTNSPELEPVRVVHRTPPDNAIQGETPHGRTCNQESWASRTAKVRHDTWVGQTSYQPMDKVFPYDKFEGIKIHDWDKWEDPSA